MAESGVEEGPVRGIISCRGLEGDYMQGGTQYGPPSGTLPGQNGFLAV